MKRMLIISDSHGADYGSVSYAANLEDNLEGFKVERLKFGGKSISFIYSEVEKYLIRLNHAYDVIIIQVGNPDVHPRMPYKVLKWFRKKGISICRDSLFSIPPKINLSYIIRFPFFLFRILFIRLYREYYLSEKDILLNFDKLISTANNNGEKLIIFPLFNISSAVYGKFHNEKVNIINNHLDEKYELLNIDIVKYHQYKKYYNYDGFHFKSKYHELLADQLINSLSIR